MAVSDDAVRRARSILEVEPAVAAAALARSRRRSRRSRPAPGGFATAPARTKQFNPPIRPGTRAVASTASRLGRVGGTGTAGPGPGWHRGHRGTGAGALAPSVHDLFASRTDRERLGSFFDYLKPGERPGAPSVVLDPQVRAMSADTAVGYRVRGRRRTIACSTRTTYRRRRSRSTDAWTDFWNPTGAPTRTGGRCGRSRASPARFPTPPTP